MLNVLTDYSNKAVWICSGNSTMDQTVSGALQQLSRVQDMSWQLNYPIEEQTYVDNGVDSYYPTPVSVDLSLTWLHSNGYNEWLVGLAKQNASGTLSLGLEDERDLYCSVEDTQGMDAIGAARTAPRTVLGLAQGVLTSYELSAAVGGIIESRATLNYLTATVYTDSSGQNVAAVDYQNGTQWTGRFVLPTPTAQYNPSVTGVGVLATEGVSAIGARDLVMMFPAADPFGVTFTGMQACYLQSFGLTMSVPREEMKPLGYLYPPARPVIYPIRVDLTTEALVSRYQADTLRRMACAATTGQAINVLVKQPCSNASLFGFYFDNLVIASQSFGASIGGLDTVSTQWRGYIKSPSDVFINPWVQYIVRTDTTGAWGTTW